MIALTAGLLLVPVLDQALKLLVLRGLAPASVPLGPLGKLQVARSRIWLARSGLGPNLARVWILWFFAAGTLAVLSNLFPSCGWFAGMLLGGSFSHALEISLRGYIIDYVRLRLWPAFNLADVAITVGALGVLVQLVLTMKEAWG
jgi:lipoprotein signal peptidase